LGIKRGDIISYCTTVDIFFSFLSILGEPLRAGFARTRVGLSAPSPSGLCFALRAPLAPSVVPLLSLSQQTPRHNPIRTMARRHK
jgi:hypothetical protein